MKKYIITYLAILCSLNSLLGQTRDNYSDDFLTNSFKIFQSADFEMANHILPFLKRRFIKELENTSSFSNSYDSLSSYIDIRYSSDSLLKTYCWSERSGSCCISSATFAQFKVESDKINYVDLREMEDGDEDVFVTDLQLIEIEGNSHYLVLGWGTCCGGKHYSTARIYRIIDDKLIKSDSVFGSESEIYAGANRGQKIELSYSRETKILSYNSYSFDDDVGFYKDEHSIVKWKLAKKEFVKIE